MTPRRRFGWVHQAISLDRLKRPAEAKELLLSAVEKLGPCSTFAFHLACVCARLGQLVEAKRWVKEAIDLAKDKATLDRLRLRVLDEPALESFWRQIARLSVGHHLSPLRRPSRSRKTLKPARCRASLSWPASSESPRRR